ncbi:MAG: Hsp20/alpha crystallin family protein [Nitrospirae bacterium]|nr:MAG: Hsp20/alpha crystallin family protein [Nitrospirota bacterium]
MSIVKWSPVKELEEMRRDMDRLFEDFLAPGRRRGWIRKPEQTVVVPNIEMFDRTDEIVVKAELPGVTKEDIDLTITKDSLTLRGEIKKEEEVKEENYYACERSFGSFTRSIALPVEVNNEKAKASFKNGVLEIVLPKREEARPKEIKIEVS